MDIARVDGLGMGLYLRPGPIHVQGKITLLLLLYFVIVSCMHIQVHDIVIAYHSILFKAVAIKRDKSNDPLHISDGWSTSLRLLLEL